MERRKKKGFSVLCFAVVLFLMSLPACSKLTVENYNRIKIGMDYAEVVKILGNASECDSIFNAKNCVWNDGKKNVTIKFVADKVVILTSGNL